LVGRGGVRHPLLYHLSLLGKHHLAEETRLWWVGRRGVAFCCVRYGHNGGEMMSYYDVCP
jgi:hypothetical protein